LDGLLATKLYLPRPQPGFVTRPRLVGQLDQGLMGSLTLVCAPAGFGKTALLADWARRGRLPVGWLSLDAGDNDPARFWRHVEAREAYRRALTLVHDHAERRLLQRRLAELDSAAGPGTRPR
jgi:ATP/maltotriose-dependent transcriptional regulator MalT